jgi:DNA modification methylase
MKDKFHRVKMIELNKIYCMDNVMGMKLLDDNSVDLTVTSPPYDSLRLYKGYTWNFEDVADQLFRVTKNGGIVVWIVDDRKVDGSETGNSMRQALYFMELGFNLHDKMIYRKLNGAMGAINEYLQEFEMMYVFSKGKPKTYNLLRDRKNVVHGDKSTPKRKSDENGSCEDRHIIERSIFGRRKNIWSYSVGGKQEFGKHPAPFPEKLAEDHIISWSNPGDIVLDPFMGSGTTAKVAKKNDRKFIGFEISREYCDISELRLGK